MGSWRVCYVVARREKDNGTSEAGNEVMGEPGEMMMDDVLFSGVYQALFLISTKGLDPELLIMQQDGRSTASFSHAAERRPALNKTDRHGELHVFGACDMRRPTDLHMAVT